MAERYVRYLDIERALKALYERYHAYGHFSQALDMLDAAGMSYPKRTKVQARSGLTLEEFMECVEQSSVPIGGSAGSSRGTQRNGGESRGSTLIPQGFDLFAFKHLKYYDGTVGHHGCFDINYLYHGGAVLNYGGVRSELKEGDLCLMAPGSSYRIEKADEGIIVMTVYLRSAVVESAFFEAMTRYGIISEFIRSVLLDQASPNYLVFRGRRHDNMRECVQNIFIETNYPDALSPSTAVHWAHIMLATVLRDFDFTYSYRGVDRTNAEFYPVLEYINGHLADVDLSSLAREFGYNESYLSTLFLSKTKRNFRDYVTDARMSRACDLLATTSLTMAQVAEAVGYASSDHFQRMFKRKMGVTPGTYRRESGTS